MHPSALLFRATTACPTRASFVLNRVVNDSIRYSRQFHVSQSALKKKSKTVQNDTLFDDSGDSDADELFGSSKPDSKQQKVPTKSTAPGKLPRGRVISSSGTHLVDENTAELLRQKESQRRDAFQNSYEYLYERTGDAAKRFAVLPAKRALHNLVNNATSSEEWQRAIELLKQWRRYPARAVPTGIQELFIRRAIMTGNGHLLVDILTHHPVYGIHISSPSVARALLKEVVTPINSFPPSYSSSQDTTPFRQRLEQALQLAEVLSIMPSGSLTAATLSPSMDDVMGPILLSALLRVSSISISETEGGNDPTALAQAIRQLIGDMQTRYSNSQTQVQSPESKPRKNALTAQETIWAIAALRECEIALGVQTARKLLAKANSEEEGSQMTVDEMTNWLTQARESLVSGGSGRGASAKRRMESAATLVERPAAKVTETKTGKKGKTSIPSHLLGKDGANAPDKRL